MSITFKTITNSKTSPDDQSLGVKIIFFALNFLAVPFSAFATFQGYRETAGGDFMAAILAALTGVLFFGLNYLIMDRRKKGLPHSLQTLGYLVPLGISFIGNFTNFYGNQVEATVLKKDLVAYSLVLKTTNNSALSTLDNSTGLVKLEQDLNMHLSQLQVQYSSGWAGECEREWTKINRLCKGNLTKIIGKKTFNKAEFIVQRYIQSLKKSKNSNIDDVKKQIDDIYDPLATRIGELQKNKQLLKDEGAFLINKIREGNDDIGALVKAKITDFTYKSLGSYNPTTKDNPMQVLKHAWTKQNLTSVETITATFFSLIIDLVTLAFIFLAIPYTKSKKHIYTGPRSL